MLIIHSPNTKQQMLKLNRLYAKSFFSKESNSSIDNKLFGIANRMGGSSHDGLYEVYAGKFKNQAIENFKKVYKKYEKFKDPIKRYNSAEIVPGTTIITNRD